MRIFAVDKNNDIHLGPDGHLAMNTELAALLQTCEHAMQALRGEMVYATERGMPYLETVWGAAPNLRLFEDAARGTLNSIEGVEHIISFSCLAEDNILKYWATIQSVYGTFELGGNKNHG